MEYYKTKKVMHFAQFSVVVLQVQMLTNPCQCRPFQPRFHQMEGLFVVSKEGKFITLKDFGKLNFERCIRTVTSYQVKVKSDGVFSGGRTSLKRVLDEMGFKYVQHD